MLPCQCSSRAGLEQRRRHWTLFEPPCLRSAMLGQGRVWDRARRRLLWLIRLTQRAGCAAATGLHGRSSLQVLRNVLLGRLFLQLLVLFAMDVHGVLLVDESPRRWVINGIGRLGVHWAWRLGPWWEE
jgi:hypothetical protein